MPQTRTLSPTTESQTGLVCRCQTTSIASARGQKMKVTGLTNDAYALLKQFNVNGSPPRFASRAAEELVQAGLAAVEADSALVITSAGNAYPQILKPA